MIPLTPERTVLLPLGAVPALSPQGRGGKCTHAKAH